MKKIAILFAVLVVLLFVTPGLIGFKVQSKHQEIIDGMQQNGLEVVSNEYQRGWFGSHAKTVFRLAMPSGVKGKSFAFTMLNDIVHGPLSPDGGLALASIGTSFLIDDKALFPEKENEVLRTRIGLDGMGNTQIVIPALKLAGKPGKPEIQFSGAEGSLSFDTGMTQIDVDLKMPGLWVGGEKGESLKFTEATLNSNSKAGLFGMFLGNGEFKVKQIDFNNPKNNIAIKIDAINFSGDTSEEEGRLTFAADYSVDQVTLKDAVYGPAQFEMSLENISADAAAKLRDGMREVRKQGLSQEEENLAIMGLLAGAGPELLQADPKLSIKRLFVKTPDGDIDGSLSVAANDLQWGEIGNPRALLKKIVADAAISLPEKLLVAMMEMQAKVTLVQQIDMRSKMGQAVEVPSDEELDTLGKEMAKHQLEFLLQQGMLKRDGTDISSQAMLNDGLLSVNGKTVPLP